MIKYVLYGIAAVAILCLLFAAHDWNTSRALKAERERIESEYQAKMNAKDAEVQDLRQKLEVMRKDYGFMKGKIKRIQDERANIVAPKDLAELRDRFTALGYPPVDGTGR